MLAEWGTNSLEFGALSRATGDAHFQMEAERVRAADSPLCTSCLLLPWPPPLCTRAPPNTLAQVLRFVHAANPSTYLLSVNTDRFSGATDANSVGVGAGAWLSCGAHLGE